MCRGHFQFRPVQLSRLCRAGMPQSCTLTTTFRFLWNCVVNAHHVNNTQSVDCSHCLQLSIEPQGMLLRLSLVQALALVCMDQASVCTSCSPGVSTESIPLRHHPCPIHAGTVAVCVCLSQLQGICLVAQSQSPTGLAKCLVHCMESWLSTL